MTLLAIAVVCSIVGYVVGLCSPCCRSRHPMDRPVAGSVGEEQAKMFYEMVEKARASQSGGCPRTCKGGKCNQGCSIPPDSPRFPTKR
jgi:hypothetical protein